MQRNDEIVRLQGGEGDIFKGDAVIAVERDQDVRGICLACRRVLDKPLIDIVRLYFVTRIGAPGGLIKKALNAANALRYYNAVLADRAQRRAVVSRLPRRPEGSTRLHGIPAVADARCATSIRQARSSDWRARGWRIRRGYRY